MANVNYVVEHFPNKNGVGLHFTEEVPYKGSAGGYCFEPNKGDNPLIARKLMTYGVESITLQSHGRYQVSLVKGRAFDWSEVLPPFLQALAAMWGGVTFTEIGEPIQ